MSSPSTLLRRGIEGLADVAQRPVLPGRPRPIVAVGAGAVVRDAHWPAYRRAGFSVACVHDVAIERARALAREFEVPVVAPTLAEAVARAPAGAVFDVAVPAGAIGAVLEQLPDGAAVLVQKPLGEDLRQARALVELCRRKRLLAAVNLQLRFAPCLMFARGLLERGALGALHDVEVRVTCDMPWQRWTFLTGIPRVEIVYHSIHYVDLVRSLLGEPSGVYCKSIKHPKQAQLASTRTAIVFDYGVSRRAIITTNHGHQFGPRHQESYVKLEGTEGSVRALLGVNLDYPRGRPDEVEYCVLGGGGEAAPEWLRAPLVGDWFPDAFIGTMASLMRHLDGETDELPTSVEDALRTMAVVEACYESSARGATPVSG
ncbi:MAG: Gfo/Idh/MocA family oxidoreductase [Myxococcales bacterium]|nr:Gfo/Idh/MocA family oxidoreductase [Myxococcales bacterium]